MECTLNENTSPVFTVIHTRAWPGAIATTDICRLAVHDCAAEVRLAEHHQQGVKTVYSGIFTHFNALDAVMTTR